ncbi:unnamed protein product, partial [Rotaria socialis]
MSVREEPWLSMAPP